jgi:HK97 family phage prohead protease
MFSVARNRRDAEAAPQSAGETPGDEFEPFELLHARGAPVRVLPIQSKQAGDLILAADIELKLASSDLKAGIVSGYGSVFGLRDRHGDIVEAGAFASSLVDHKAKNQMPAMLWSHDPERPIGVWQTAVEDRHGLKLTGQLNLDTQDGREARSLLLQGAFNGLSIGYRVPPGGASIDRTGTRRLKSVELWEVSLVTFPSNEAARIDGVKGISSSRDLEGFLRASGFPKSAARKIASGGWPALHENHNGAADLLAAVRSATSEIRKG